MENSNLSLKTNSFPGHPFLKRVHCALDQNIGNAAYQSAHLSTEMHLSRTQLYRKLKEFTGSTFTEMMLEKRIDRAKDLISKSDLNITAIAFELGYCDPSYFVKVFKKKVGVTPSEFKNARSQQA